MILYTTYTYCTTVNPDNLMTKYADDTAIVGRMLSADDSLQCYKNEISHFTNWCVNNYLEINVNKTKETIVDFRKKYGTSVPAVIVNGQPIERVAEYRYLMGTVLDDKLNCLMSTQNLQSVNYGNVSFSFLGSSDHLA